MSSEIYATYLSPTQFTLNYNDPRLIKDRRIEADCGTDGRKYGTIADVVYNNGSDSTTVTIFEAVLTENLIYIMPGLVCSGPTSSLPRHSHTSNEQGGLLEGTGGGGITIYSGNDLPGTGENILGSDGAYIWNESLTGKRYLVSVVSNIYKAVEMT